MYTWWQTETGGILISPLPELTSLKPGSVSWPFYGITPSIVDDNGKHLADGEMGHLVITKPWPGMMLTIYGDAARFVNTYFSGSTGERVNYYITGDLAKRDADGYFWIEGRDDDVLKVAGHRIGSQEVESALVSHPDVAEAAVVGKVDDIKGQRIYAFVTLKAHAHPSDALSTELKNKVRESIGAIAILDHIQWTDGLPKTRSGKIMRRLLRKIANHDTNDLGDLSTLADPEVVDALIQNAI